MERPRVGFVFVEHYNLEADRLMMKALGERMEVVAIPYESQYDVNDLIERTMGCSVVFNYSAAAEFTFGSLELTKTLEELGKKVVNSSHSYYYQEDKWMFYLKCLEHGLPTPVTHFIPRKHYNPSVIKRYLNSGPLVLKAVYSDEGMCVERAAGFDEFKKKLKKIMAKNPTSPVIAQEYIPNSNRSYRVTLAGGKVVQSIVKIGTTWKTTGSPWKKERYRKVRLSPKLARTCMKAAVVLGMDVCGLDLVEHEGRWYIIEANSCPGFTFIKYDQERVMLEVADYLYRLCRKKS